MALFSAKRAFLCSKPPKTNCSTWNNPRHKPPKNRRQKMTKKFLKTFSIFDLMIIAILASLGIAVSSITGYLVRLITGPLMIPGGAVAGGIYMMFLILAVAFTNKKTAAALCGFVQALIVMITGFGGHHGAMTIVTYTMPGIMVLLLLLAMRHNGCCTLCCFFAGVVANLTGTFLVGAGVMALPAVPMYLSLGLASISGGLGGLLAYAIIKQVKSLGVLK